VKTIIVGYHLLKTHERLMCKSIVHITTVHNPNDTRITKRMCNSIAEYSDFYCSIICFEANLIKNKKLNKISLGPKLSRFNRLFKIFDIIKIIKRNNFNIVHIHDPELFILVFFLNKNTRTIIDLHENYWVSILEKHYIPKLFRKILQLFVQKYLNLCLKNCDLVVTAWPKINEYVKKKNIITINNYPPANYDVVHKNKSSTTRFIFSGLISFERGIVEAINLFEIFSSDKKSELKIIGRFKSFDEKVYLNKVLKQHSNIELYEWMSQDELYQNMRWADFGFIFFHDIPNHRFSIPNKLFEYIQNKVIPLTSDLPFLYSFNKLNKCGVSSNIFNNEYFLRKLYLITTDLTVKMNLLKNHDKIIQKYTWEEEFLKLHNCYLKLI